MKKELFIQLEKAILARTPKLAEALQPGLPEAQVMGILSRAQLDRNVDAVVGLYSWKNGVAPSQAQESFFPDSIYEFLPLEAAVDLCATMQKAINTLAELGSPIKMPRESGRYLPVFWDGVTGSLAIDLRPGMRNRVMEIEFESEEPFREVYDSFEAFLADVVRAIQEDEAPSFVDLNFSS